MSISDTFRVQGIKRMLRGKMPRCHYFHAREVKRISRLSNLAARKKLDYLVYGLGFVGKFYNQILFEMAMRYLSVSEKERFVKEGKIAAEALNISLSIENCCGHENLDRMLQELHNHTALEKVLFQKIFSSLLDLQSRPVSNKKCILQRKLDEIQEIFDLKESEKEVLLFLFLIATDIQLERMCAETSDIVDTRNDYAGNSRLKKTVRVLTGLSKRQLEEVFSDRSTTFQTGLIRRDGDLAVEVIDFLDGISSKPFSERYFREYTGEVLPLEAYAIDKKCIETIIALKKHKKANSGINIFLYGPGGTGKTSLARSLAKFFQQPLFEIRNLPENQCEKIDLALFRYRGLFACQRIVDIEKGIVLVDEADALLNATQVYFPFFQQTVEKGLINRILDDQKGFVIWIANRWEGIAESTKRRFDYSIEFERMSFRQRKAVWTHSAAKYGLGDWIDDATITSLCEKYEVSAGGIEAAIRNASRIYRNTSSKSNTLRAISSILKAHEKILHSELKSHDEKTANAPVYSLDGLNIKEDVSGAIALIDKFNDRWIEDETTCLPNLNILLYGPPGTGKTEFVRYVARRTHRRLIIKRSSDLLGCYIGETEKAIRLAFREAEQEQAILFFDEADSFFWNRESASRSWEITQVNELLQSMESHQGLFICATNLPKIVDYAAIRRFLVKLHFDFLSPEGIERFYNIFLNNLPEISITPEEKAEVRSLSGLAPGDFKVVCQTRSLFNRNEITHQKLIEALKQELAAKNSDYGKKMGF